MLTLLFAILFIAIFGKLLMLSFKAAWGLTKIVFTLVLLPVALIGLVVAGLIYLSLFILIVVGIMVLIGKKL